MNRDITAFRLRNSVALDVVSVLFPTVGVRPARLVRQRGAQCVAVQQPRAACPFGLFFLHGFNFGTGTRPCLGVTKE